MELIALYDAGFNEPIKQVFCDGEFEENSTIRKFRIVQTEGFRQVSCENAHYNLQWNVQNDAFL